MKKGYSTVSDYPCFDEKREPQNWWQTLCQKKREILLNRVHSRSLRLKLLSTFVFFGLVLYFIQRFTFSYIGLALSDETTTDLMKAIPSSDHIKSYFETYAKHSHLAGSDADFKLAEWTRDQFIDLGEGYIDTKIETYYPTLNYPLQRRLAVLNASDVYDVLFEASLKEDKGDTVPTFHAYSGDGNVTGPVVYVNYGRLSDFQFLHIRGVSFKGTIALVRYGKISRGLKVKMAQDYGCIGAILYTDPSDEGPTESDDGNYTNKSYPDGPWRSADSVERGSVQFLSYMTGDPTTPGYASTLDAERVPVNETINIPKIPSLPISWKEALPLLKATEGYGFKSDITWQGGLCDVNYYVGPSQAQINLVNINDYQVKKIWNVVGKIPGSEEPEKSVIIGNHRDAWGYGAVDPSSGSAILLELVRALGVLSKRGWRPRRTIIIASWDGEEYGAVGSTEWAEEHKCQLRKEAVAYINVDYAVSGRHFNAQASPLLNRLIYEVTREVVDPHSSVPVFEVWKSDRILPISKDETVFEDITLQEHPLVDPLGSDSDYTAFFNHLGIASASIGFRGHDYGVHHSLYDSIDWMNQYGDPTYEYHQALTKIWGLMMIRLASDYFLPLYPHDYAIEIARSLGHISNQQGCLTFPSISPALSELTSRSHHFNKKARKWKHKLQKKSNLTKKVKKHMRKHNNRVLYFERALTDSQGLPNRPWFKHLIYAPQLYTGLPQAFPSLLEVVEANNDPEAIVSVENRIGNALSKARKVLKGHFNDLDMGLQDDFEEDEDLEEEDDLYDDDYE